jgi:predicted DNA-binding protein
MCGRNVLQATDNTPMSKMQMIRARVSMRMKRDLARLAAVRGEAEAVLVREALRAYIEKQRQRLSAEETPKL